MNINFPLFLRTFIDLGFVVTNPNEITEIMPKTRFEAEDNGVDIIIDCTGVPGENLLISNLIEMRKKR